MANGLIIHHPDDQNPITPGFFVAFGLATNLGHAQIRGFLTQGGQQLSEGRLLRSCPFWAVALYANSGLPVANPNPITLEIRDAQAQIILGSVDIKVAPAITAVKINYPGSNAVVCGSNLVAYGTVNYSSSVTGTMQLANVAGSPILTGVTIQQPDPPGYLGWAIQFTNIPPGGPYTLTVTGPLDGSTRSTNITVNMC
jgi:hypothetical protein